jgi:hypothetical protein
MIRMLLIITAVSLTVASGAALAMGVGAASGFSWNQAAADASARAWAAEGSCGWLSGVIHVPLYSRRCLLTALTPVSTNASSEVSTGALEMYLGGQLPLCWWFLRAGVERFRDWWRLHCL